MRFVLLLFLAGCACPDLTIYTQYDTPERLASTYMRTPDPRRWSIDTQGQTLIVTWYVPEVEGYRVELTRVFRNGERRSDSFDFTSVSGRYEIPLRGCDYFETGGLLSYQATLFHDNEVVKVAAHPLYVELITTKREQKQRAEKK